ncbi:DUF2380 domain-containing protein [Candidatus Neomarinimicrobiota bacterium]
MNTSRLSILFLIIAVPLLQIVRAAPAPQSTQLIPIVVMDFDGYGISESEAVILSDRLRNQLFRLGQFHVVERGLMATILKEQDFDLQGCASDQCMVEVGQLLGADQIVGGSVSKIGNTYSISARLVDIESGKVLRVSDYDHRGAMDDLLTDAIPMIAKQLSSTSPAVAQRNNMLRTVRSNDHRWTLSVSGGSKTDNGITVYDQGAVIVSFFRDKPLSFRNRTFPVTNTLMIGGGNWYDQDEHYEENFGAIMIGTGLSRHWSSFAFETNAALGPGAVYYTSETGVDGPDPTIDEGTGLSLFYSLSLQIAVGTFPVVAELRFTNDVRYQQQVLGVGAGYRW